MSSTGVGAGSTRKAERLVNLVICLLATRRPLTVDQIRAAVPGYVEAADGDDTAFRRMFERDKDELRQLGVPLETVVNPGWHDDEWGYRIARRDYELPEITLDPDEAAAVGLAVRLWGSAGLASAASSALLKLRSAGVDVDARAGAAGFEPRVEADEPAFADAFAAVRAGRAVTFDYLRSGATEPSRRTVEPWGVVSWRGRWYLVGHDRERSATRAFRLSRVTGPVRATGPAGAVVPPAGVDLVAQVAAVETQEPSATAVVRVRAGSGHALRREATATRPAAEGGGDGDERWDVLDLPYADADRLADRLAGHGADVVVLDPPEARDAVVRRLRAAAGATP